MYYSNIALRNLNNTNYTKLGYSDVVVNINDIDAAIIDDQNGVVADRN